MHILPMLTELEVHVLGDSSDIFFFVHLNCGSNAGTNTFEARHGKSILEPHQLPCAHAQTPRSALAHLQQRRHPVQPEVIAESG